MYPVQIGQATHKRQEDEDEDSSEADNIVEHPTEGDEQRAELFISGQKVGDPCETQHASQGKKYISQLVHVRHHT